jgi:lipopolysaccharide transport system ATP-binding protein
MPAHRFDRLHSSMTSSAVSNPLAGENLAISAEGVGKRYRLWKSPGSRLKYSVLSQAHRTIRSLAGNEAPLLGPIAQAREGLCETFDALREVSFSIRQGESVAIIGRNGSGKSTLLQILAGTLQPTYGAVATYGPLAAMLELGSGFNPEFTGRENVYLNASVLGFPRAQTAARFADIEKFADIGQFIDQPVKSYSSGMVVRLAFAVLVHIEPQILIIDEALAVGDFLFQQKCFDHLRKFRERGCTFLFVSHTMSTVLDLCSRALLLEKGRLKFDGPAKEAVDIYEGSALQDRYGDRGPVLRMQQESEKAGETLEPSAAPMSIVKPEPSAVPAPETVVRPAPAVHWPLANVDEPAVHHGFEEAEEAVSTDPESTDADAGSLATDSVRLRFVRLYGADGAARDWITSEEEVTLSIGVACLVALDDPHIGFKIRDKLGRVIFETSSLCMRRQVGEVGAGETLVSRFRFALPLQIGQYSVTVGFANGGVGDQDYREVLLFQHGTKTFEIVRKPEAIIWSGVVNLRPQVTFTRQYAKPEREAPAPAASAV